MANTVCIGVKQGLVKARGIASLEYRDKNGKAVYGCLGWKSRVTDEALEVCANCPDYVVNIGEKLESKGDSIKKTNDFFKEKKKERKRRTSKPRIEIESGELHSVIAEKFDHGDKPK